MKNSAITGIIALMSLALMGSILLQLNWISSAVKLNEEDFDNNVVSALNDVAIRLKDIEQSEAYQATMNGFSQSYLEREANRQLSDEVGQVMELIGTYEKSVSKDELMDYILSENNCQCSQCTAERNRLYSTFVNISSNLPMLPLTDRVGDLQRLDHLLKQELADHGISTDYRYGVFSNKKNSFVIADNHFVVEEDNYSNSGFQPLINSNYRVSLYDSGPSAPGSLHVFFPGRASFLWGNLWK